MHLDGGGPGAGNLNVGAMWGNRLERTDRFRFAVGTAKP